MKKIIVITGPTGVGKTKLSISLAKYFNGIIINADSMQIYKELNIGTAKISKKEQEHIKHYLIDVKGIDETYSVYDYQHDARAILDQVGDEKMPIIVGGTGLYIKSLLYDYSFYKHKKSYAFDDFTNEELLDKIKEYNHDINIHINNRQRLESVLNNYLNEGNYSNNGYKLLYDVIFIGLTTKRDVLYKIIDERVDKMFDNGLLNEVKVIYDKGVRSKPLLTGIGYKELYQYFDGLISLEEAKELIKKDSRHYAKRQYTWFNNQMDITWFDVNFDNFRETELAVINYIEKNL